MSVYWNGFVAFVCWVVAKIVYLESTNLKELENANFLILRNQYHYCEGPTLLENIEKVVDLDTALDHCAAMFNCSYVTIGPRWPELSAVWLCSSTSWQQREHNPGWMMAIKKSSFGIPDFELKVNTKISSCSVIGTPESGFFTLQSASMLCRENADCTSFQVSFVNNISQLGERGGHQLSVQVTFCSDSPNTIKKEGWGKGEISELFRILSQTLCFLKSHVLVTAFLVPDKKDVTNDLTPGFNEGKPQAPKIGVLRAHDFVDGTSNEKGVYDTGIITQHKYWQLMPKAGVLYPT